MRKASFECLRSRGAVASKEGPIADGCKNVPGKADAGVCDTLVKGSNWSWQLKRHPACTIAAKAQCVESWRKEARVIR